VRVLSKCCAAIALHLLVLPLAAQEDGSTDSVDLQEQLALDTNALAVLPIEILTTDPRAPALAAEAYELILNELALIDGLYVIGRESVLPYADSALPAVEIARGLGVGTVLESSIRADLYTISLDVGLIDARTGESRGSQTSLLRLSPNVHISNPPFDLNTLMPDMASRVAERVQSTLFPTADLQPDPQPDPQQAIADAEAIVLDASLSDNERLDALERLRRRSEWVRGGAVVIAAVQIAMSSDESQVRGRVWREMAGVDDPYLIQPLLHALANDIDEGVRRAAAETLLRGFRDEPEVRAALEYAAENDASEWVRNKIRLSILPEAERHEELLTIVSDSTKPDMERLGAAYDLLRSDGSPVTIRGPKALSREAIIAIMGLASTTGSRRTRSEALRLLRGADDPYLVEPLLIALANDSYEHVRDAAAEGLAEFLDEAGVREALEEALVNDPSPLVRKTAGESLGSVER
jgi:TolB-like protein/HEAT repeat protein